MHVLIADDDPVYRSLFEELLGQWGFQITSTADGREAWQALCRDPTIRIVVLDWMMPEMDGYEVCRRIKQDADRPELYVILVTGNQLKEEVIKVVAVGADDYVIKPFEPLDLKIRLRAAVRIIELQAQLTGPWPSVPAPAGGSGPGTA